MTKRYTPFAFARTSMFVLVLFSAFSCNDFIDAGAPKSQIASATIFENPAAATSALRGIYSMMMSNTSFTNGYIEEYTGMTSDELINYSTSTSRLQFSQNSLTALNSDVLNVFWGEAYKYISNANVIIEGLEKSTAIETASRNKLIGEARFIRAFCHFYLANLFGDIPYLTSSNYQENAKASRVAYKTVMSQIENELAAAREMMSKDFPDYYGERIQPSRDAATALLARVYLFEGNWSKAEAMASELINKSDTYSLQQNLEEVFLSASSEAIWQLKPVMPETGAPQALLFILNATPSSYGTRVTMNDALVNAFEEDDRRKIAWTKTFTEADDTWTYMYKYTSPYTPKEYSIAFRLAEQYLIRAEARAKQDNLDGAKSDINIIRNRAGLSNTLATAKSEMIAAIEQENRVEMFGEFGHRWIDLKRSGRIDAVMSSVKSQWQSTDALFPIPNAERLLNPNLGQNPGY